MRSGHKVKLSRNGFTVSTHRFHSYPGDNSVQVQVIDSFGTKRLRFNMWPTSVRGMRIWDSDRAGSYWTITAAKKAALEYVIKNQYKAKKKESSPRTSVQGLR
jgi:hypothetical protein